MIDTIRDGLRALRLRAGGDAGDRIHRRARQVPARPGPAERRRVLVPGRRRAVAVAALRPDRAARALRRGEFRQRCRSPIAAIASAGCSATRSRARAASASSCSSTPTRWARASPAADAEICMMAADTMEALGIPRGSYVVKVNNRKVLDGVMEADRPRRRGQCRHGVSPCCARSTSSIGWASTACGNCSAKAARTRAAISPKAPASTPAAIDRVLGVRRRRKARTPATTLGEPREGRRGLGDRAKRASTSCARFPALTTSSGYADDRILIDPSVVRGLEYYTGPVYEVELLLETKDEKGRPVRFGSVGGGGRYDGLVSRFRGEPVPATGFSIGVSRLQAALTMIGKLDSKAGARPGGGHRVRPRPHRRLPEDGRGAAQRRHPRRALSRQPEELRQPAQIRRQARLALRRHPGRRREGARARCRSRT